MTRSRRYVACLVAIVLVLPLVAACGAKTIGGAIDDQTITARVKTALLNDPQVGATRIDIDTSNGVVTMSGVVKSKAEETRAIQLARQVNGVRDVKSALQVPGS